MIKTTLLAGLVCLISCSAFADVIPQNNSEPEIFNLPPDALALVPLKSELVSVKSLCPRGVMCATAGTVITLKYTLTGCVDMLTPVRAKAVKGSDGKLDIYVSAESVTTEASTRTRCFAPNTETFTITLINQFFKKGEVRIVDIGL